MSRIFTHTIPSTAGNATYSIQPAGARRWKVHSLWLQLTTDATVADRRIRVRNYDSPALSHELGNSVYGATRAAGGSTTLTLSATVFLSSATVGSNAHAGLSEPVVLDVSNSLTISVENGVVGDAVIGYAKIEEYPSES